MTKTSKSLSDAKITQMQELGSAWVFKRAIQDNISFKSSDDIVKDKVTYQMIEDRVRNRARANLTPGFREQLEEEAKKRGIIKQ